MKQDHPIFKAAVIVTNQKECDVARKICEEHELPTWEDVELAFKFVEYDEDDDIYLKYQQEEDDNTGFFIDHISQENDIEDYNVMSMKEFEELAIDYSLIGLSLEQLKQKFQETLRS